MKEVKMLNLSHSVTCEQPSFNAWQRYLHHVPAKKCRDMWAHEVDAAKDYVTAYTSNITPLELDKELGDGIIELWFACGSNHIKISVDLFDYSDEDRNLWMITFQAEVFNVNREGVATKLSNSKIIHNIKYYL
jgi:hypothetical protein